MKVIHLDFGLTHQWKVVLAQEDYTKRSFSMQQDCVYFDLKNIAARLWARFAFCRAHRMNSSTLTRLRAEWAPSIPRELLAGAVATFALIPEVIAFSFVAGVDPSVGLFASFVISLVIAYAFLFRIPQTLTGLPARRARSTSHASVRGLQTDGVTSRLAICDTTTSLV